MKILLKAFAIVLSFIVTSSFCFASDCYALDDSIQPCYVATQYTMETFSISSSGNAFMNVSLSPKSTTLIDEVKVILKIRNAYGTSFLNKTYNASWDNLSASYELTKMHQLSKKGTYEFQAVYKCYNDGTLVETISSSYIVDIY